MPILKLTQAAVVKIKPPAAGRVEYWDTVLAGFGVRMSAGRKTWQAMYRVRGRLVRETLGTLATIPKVDQARDLARASMTKAQQGIHPGAERQQAAAAERGKARAEAARRRNTLGAVIDRYLADRPGDRSRRPMRAEYLAETARTLERDVKGSPLGTKSLAEVAGEDIRQLVRGIAKTAPSQANHTLAYLSAFFGWAVDEGLLAANPAAGVKKPAQRVERERTLEDDEIRLFWTACERVGWPFGPLARLLLLTAQRRDELAQATWDEFALARQTWTLPGTRTKNGRSHIVHLSAPAVAILDKLPRIVSNNGWVFTTGLGADTPISGFGRGRERITAAMTAIAGEAVAPFTLHDLRRSAATGMAALGTAPHVVDKILNHSTGKIAGVARIYNRFEYLPERAAALETWGRHIEGLVPAAASNVVQLVKAG